MNIYMQKAIQEAHKGIQKLEGGPFGACVIQKGKILATAHNTVLKAQDSTCHAEMNAIRQACRKLKTWDLSGCEIYSTTEPCPMCFSAIHWARLTAVYFGTAIQEVKRRGFNELNIPSESKKKTGGSPVHIIGGLMRNECLDILKAWDKLKSKPTY